MKKTYSILTLLAAVAGFTSCSNDELSENNESNTNKVIVYATTNAASRATLSNDYNVLWSTGDQIKFVNDENDAVTYNFTLKEQKAQKVFSNLMTDKKFLQMEAIPYIIQLHTMAPTGLHRLI